MCIKVLTVEDSTLIRLMINNTIKEIDDVELVGTSENGKSALEKIKILQPDVVILDLVMPIMDGLETLEKLREFSDVPVIILSSLSDSETTIKALELGAQEFIAKPESFSKNKEDFKIGLENRIKAFSTSNTENEVEVTESSATKDVSSVTTGNVEAIMIGASTGGPKVITQLLQALPKDYPIPIFVVQHMPEGFTKSFSNRLNSICDISVTEASDGMPIEKGQVYIAPGGQHMVVDGRQIRLLNTEKIHNVKPAVDPLFKSVVDVYGKKTIAILLSGMGKDGGAGCIEVKRAGGNVFVQHQDSCVVYGMPKHAVELGASDEELSIEEIITVLTESVRS